MIKFFLVSLCGLAAGIAGGMGMGGGTFLIPLLIMFFGVDAHMAAVLNLLGFLPTATAALIVHFRNGFIEKKGIFFIMIPALLSSVAAYFVGRCFSGKALARIFGWFLLALSLILLVVRIKKAKEGN